MKKLWAILLVLCLCATLGVSGFASGEASGDASGGTAAEDTGPKAILVFGDEGEDIENEQTEDFQLLFYTGGGQDEAGIRSFSLVSDASATALFYSEPTEITVTYTIGGDAANISLEDYPGTLEAAQFLHAVGVDSFDSAVILGEDGADSCPPVMSAKGWTNLTIEGVMLLAAGPARSAFYSDVSGGATVAGPSSVGGQQGQEEPVVIVSNSILETTGGAGTDGEIAVGASSGRARGIQPQGKSITYLYNSAIVSRTWGAWSTDSARQALDLVAWRSLGMSQGGYGAYADTSCHLFLYGSTVMGSSDGIVASNNGEIYATDSADETNTTDLRAVMGRTSSTRDLCWTDYPAEAEEAADSVIMGGQTAVQFHMPDMGHSGAGNKRIATLYMDGGVLATDDSLLQNGVDGLAAYNRRYAGACIVTKSTQGNILLQGTAMESWSGELIHTMINSDSNVNDIADGDETIGSDITFMNMDVAGDIVHDDYQRELYLTLDNTTLTGAVYCNTWEDWNALCEAEFDGSYILNPDGYDTWWGVTLTLSGNAVFIRGGGTVRIPDSNVDTGDSAKSSDTGNSADTGDSAKNTDTGNAGKTIKTVTYGSARMLCGGSEIPVNVAIPDSAGVAPAPLLVRRLPGPGLRLHVLMFGGGPAIRAKTYRVFHKHDAQTVLDEIVAWATDSVRQLGCSPCTLAVGIGRSHFEAASMMLQAQADGDYAVQSGMEREITRRVNAADIGPLGLHGKTSVLATFLKVGPQRASGVRIVCLRPACCFEPRIATVELLP